MRVISILGDSISMIRPKEDIYLKDIYSYKLQEKLKNEYYVVNSAMRGSYAKLQYNNLTENVLYNNPEIVIVFFGIVDCFPRLFSLKEKKIMYILTRMKLGIINRIIISIKSRYRYFFTKNIRKVYTNIAEFESLYKKIIEMIIELESMKIVILVNIPATNQKTIKRNYGVVENIENYNEIIRKISETDSKIRLVDFYNMTKEEELVLEDGMHINKKGHICIADKFYEIIKEYEREKNANSREN